MALIGAGRVATAFGVLLERAGYRVVAASGREGSKERIEHHLPRTDFVSGAEAAERAEISVLGVPDDLIADTCGAMASAFRRGQFVAHLSGAAGLDVLDAADRAGADVLSVHPMQSFPDVQTGVARLPGSAVAVTARTEPGHRLGRELAAAVGARPFSLPDASKPLYHAAAVFCSNYLVVVEAVAERLLRLARVPDPLAAAGPLARTSLESALARGPAWALTGPAVRGDRATVARNLAAIHDHAPATVPLYVALARAAVALAVDSGRLDEGSAAALEEELGRWT